jgi:hypothetical protein
MMTPHITKGAPGFEAAELSTPNIARWTSTPCGGEPSSARGIVFPEERRRAQFFLRPKPECLLESVKI